MVAGNAVILIDGLDGEFAILLEFAIMEGEDSAGT
jgi:hypothetical protein